MKTTLKAPGTKLLKLKHDEPLSKFAFKFNLRLCATVTRLLTAAAAPMLQMVQQWVVAGRGLHSFPFPLNVSLLCPFPLDLSLLCPPHNPN